MPFAILEIAALLRFAILVIDVLLLVFLVQLDVRLMFSIRSIEFLQPQSNVEMCRSTDHSDV